MRLDYRETAAKFQKEWHVKEPQRDFDFARHVKGRALVSVVNSGLIYYALEREHARHQVRREIYCLLDSLFFALSSFFFSSFKFAIEAWAACAPIAVRLTLFFPFG